MTALVAAVARDDRHRISKPLQDAIRLIAGYGVEGDAHAGVTVMHRYDRRKSPDAPNLRQVHLVHEELFAELAAKGFAVGPGAIGENVTTRGIDLLALSRGTRLRLGADAVIEITGLRNPCALIDQATQRGVMAATLEKRSDGTILRKTGVMAIVLEGGEVRPGDGVAVAFTPDSHVALEPV